MDVDEKLMLTFGDIMSCVEAPDTVRYFLWEPKPGGGGSFVRKWDRTHMMFKDRMTAEVLAEGLRHAGRNVEVKEIDLASETPAQ